MVVNRVTVLVIVLLSLVYKMEPTYFVAVVVVLETLMVVLELVTTCVGTTVNVVVIRYDWVVK